MLDKSLSRTERVVIVIVSIIIITGITIASMLYFPILIYIIFGLNIIAISIKHVLEAWYDKEKFNEKFDKK